MSDLRTAAQQALEALESTQLFAAHEHYPRRRVADALDALRAALEQPERAQQQRDAGFTRRPTIREMSEPEQPEQEPIPFSGADEKTPVFGRRWRIAKDGFGLQLDDGGPYVHIDDALSVLHAALEQPEQAEPVACSNTFACRCPKHYTHPPRREWRGLTEKEHEKARHVCRHVGVEGLVLWLEDKLKERNA